MLPEEPGQHGSLEEVIREEDFLQLLETQGKPFFLLVNTLLDLATPQWEKGHMFRLVLETNELESFLDDFGARKNKSFGYLGELVATLRWLAQACFTLEHVSLRVNSYKLAPDYSATISPAIRQRTNHLKESARRVMKKTREVVKELGLRIATTKLDNDAFSKVRAERYLPENINEPDVPDESTRVAEISARFLAVADMVRAAFPLQAEMTPEELAAFVTRFCREEQLRICTVSVHNLQSKYDTFIKNTHLEKQTPDLPSLRGHISLALHLLECATYLIHLDERHENDLRAAKTRRAIAALVDRPALLSTVVDFCLAQTLKTMKEGTKPAKKSLGQFSQEEEVELSLPRGVFLHARPASMIVSVVNHYAMPVEIQINGQRANASSIMAVMILAGQNPGVRKVTFCGEAKVLRDLRLLFKLGLTEKGATELPPELDYLTRPDQPPQ